jgi:hypothetical protein
VREFVGTIIVLVLKMVCGLVWVFIWFLSNEVSYFERSKKLVR